MANLGEVESANLEIKKVPLNAIPLNCQDLQ